MKSTCPYCGVGCGIEIDQPATNLVITGDAEHPANFGKLCIKGSSLPETLGSQGRLLQPLIDRQPATWDQALDLIASKIKSSIDQYGSDSIAMYLSGQILTEDYYVANKLLKGFIGTANVDTNSRLCMASTVVGHKRAFGEDLVPGNYEDFNEAELILFVGSNAAWNHPVIYQRISDAKAANPDLKVVLIDPRRTATADLADLHLQIQPGKDTLLFNALLASIAESPALKRDYIDAHTQGFEKALAAAQADTANKNALLNQLGIEEQLFNQFIEWFIKTERTVTLFSQGINQSSSGSDKVNAIINCHLATGRIGKPGMGPLSLTGQPNAMGGREVGGLANQLAAHEDFSDPLGIERIERFWCAPNIARTEGKKAVEMFNAIERGEIKVVWIMGTNPVVSMPNANQIKRALEHAELVIVSEAMDCTDTLAFADIALPATTWSEKQGTVTNSDRVISRQRGFLRPPGEARHDWWAVTEVAKRLGYGSSFSYTTPADIFREHAALSGFMNDGRKLFDISALATISDEAYEQFSPIRWPVNATNPKGTDRLLADGRFPTSTGKANFLAVQQRAAEQLPQQGAEFILNTGRIRDQWHTMTRTGRASKLMQHRQEPFLEIGPEDAARLHLHANQLVSVKHVQQGESTLRVRIEPGQRRGELFVPMHWTEQFSSNPRINQLIEAATDPFSGQPESKHGRVQIEPVKIASYAYLISHKKMSSAQLGNTDYWALIPLDTGYLYSLATTNPEFDWVEALHIQSRKYPSMIAQGRTKTQLRAAWLDTQDRLETLLVVTDSHQRPDLSWVASLCASELKPEARTRLLSLTPPSGVDLGIVICSCFQIRDSQIEKAVDEGCDTLQALQKKLRCGSNCGSCIPEIKAFLPEPALENT